ncbi:hypothetical protein DKB58_06685 [Capnocytophaga canimorsus]|uniref:hypothetical protein n=1 Tax=Capnocytophaga canimorsus TaxID=28188 RepID=UPI000D6DDFE0|nr:hypothetical protein [Capnocytophaga canimorsus]AWL78651.1 hypothetical protein DKB58_06685 [Capnocytophaga canimorsus]
MDEQLWEKIQMFIDAGLIGMVSHLLVEEVEQQLTPEQLEPLGDLNHLFLTIFARENNFKTPVKTFVAGLVYMAKTGAIVKKNIP